MYVPVFVVFNHHKTCCVVQNTHHADDVLVTHWLKRVSKKNKCHLYSVHIYGTCVGVCGRLWFFVDNQSYNRDLKKVKLLPRELEF